MSLWHRRHGPLTAELEQVPGGFGLGQVPIRLRPTGTASMVCGFCSTGCSLDVHLHDGEAVNLSPTTEYPVNRGMACPKGWEALTPLRAPDRATTPLLRNPRGRLEPVDWPTALSVFAERFRAIQKQHGPDSLAFLSTGQIPTEEMALLGALTKFGMGIVHGDGNTRQCMATSVVAYKDCFGFDAPPYTYADFEASDVVVLWGSNLCVAHPILWDRVCRNPHQPDVIVVDPRVTETAAAATTHHALRPKSDLALLYGLAHVIIREDLVDAAYVAAHTADFEQFAAHVATFTPERVARDTGLEVGAIEEFGRTIGRGERVSLWWTMGVNQSHEGVAVAEAIIALALMTGNVGRPGTGANSITGQCNAMGSRLFSNTTSLFAGRDFTNASDRADVARILGIPEGRIPSRPSWAYDQIMEGIARGTVRGLWVVATNTAHSWINQSDAHDLLDRLDFLVVQDMYTSTETAARADLVLPAAGWGEKDGTFVNSERRIGRVRRVARAPGQALADFAIFKLVAEAWGCADMLREWTTPEAVFDILKRLSAGRPCDITGIEGYDMLDQVAGVQWPHRAGDPAPARERRLFEDGRFFHADGRARFMTGEPRPPVEQPTERFPLILLTGRGNSAQWHTLTRTAKSRALSSLSPREPYVEVAPGDAARLGLTSGDHAVVASARGSMRARVFATPSMAEGQVFVPMHYAETNQLTHPSFDPRSRQPSYKWATVSLRPLESWER